MQTHNEKRALQEVSLNEVHNRPLYHNGLRHPEEDSTLTTDLGPKSQKLSGPMSNYHSHLQANGHKRPSTKNLFTRQQTLLNSNGGPKSYAQVATQKSLVGGKSSTASLNQGKVKTQRRLTQTQLSSQY